MLPLWQPFFFQSLFKRSLYLSQSRSSPRTSSVFVSSIDLLTLANPSLLHFLSSFLPFFFLTFPFSSFSSFLFHTSFSFHPFRSLLLAIGDPPLPGIHHHHHSLCSLTFIVHTLSRHPLRIVAFPSVLLAFGFTPVHHFLFLHYLIFFFTLSRPPFCLDIFSLHWVHSTLTGRTRQSTASIFHFFVPLHSHRIAF